MRCVPANFVKTPSKEILEKFTKEQLLKIAHHYNTEISDKRLETEKRQRL